MRMMIETLLTCGRQLWQLYQCQQLHLLHLLQQRRFAVGDVREGEDEVAAEAVVAELLKKSKKNQQQAGMQLRGHQSMLFCLLQCLHFRVPLDRQASENG